MMRKNSLSIFCAALAMLGALCIASPVEQPATSQPAPIVLTDVAGTVQKPLELGSAKAAVLIFISVDCPVSNSYAPEINRICKQYEQRGVRFYLVHSDPDLTEDRAKKHAADYGFTCPVLIDRKLELVHRLGPRRQSEAAVVAADGHLAYRGRIDDLYISLGKRRYEATTHDLRNAIDNVLAGKPVNPDRTKAVGCVIGVD